jgi:hypothetical protein
MSSGGDILLARSFRICDKKRGNRRTGSEALGRIGEVLFFSILFLLGCGGLIAILVALVIPEWRVHHVFAETTCTVLDREFEKSESGGGTLYRPEVRIRFVVDGTTYIVRTYDIHSLRGNYALSEGDTADVAGRFLPSGEYSCWYDPSDPHIVVLVRESSWWFWLALMVPISGVLIGGGGIVYRVVTWGASAERRAALVKRAASLDLFDPEHTKSGFPCIPRPANITNSPGTTLAFRLPVTASPGWTLFLWLIACLLWNGIVSVFVYWTVKGHLQGRPDWLLTCVIIPFVLAGIGLVVFFFRQLLVTTGIGPTLVEISDHPLLPGRQYDVFLSQTGRLRMSSLEVLLVCDEEATYRQGTNTRTEKHRVYERPMFRHEDFHVRQDVPFEARLALEVPLGAMHSFKSQHNEINWSLVVKGKASGWPEYRRAFPLIVYPGGAVRNGKRA